MTGNGPLVESLYARLRSQQESLNVMRADRNNLYEALRGLVDATDKHPARVSAAESVRVDSESRYNDAIDAARAAIDRIDKRTW